MIEGTIRRPNRETEDKIAEIWERELGEISIPIDRNAIWVSSVLYEGVEERYGPNGTQPLTYHDPDHTTGVMSRDLRTAAELYKELPERFPVADFGLHLNSAAGHDAFHHTKDRSKDEKISADATQKVMHARGNVYTGRDCTRVGRAILATQVAFNEQGFIEQIELRKGDPDLLKLILAYADINGIAMEGTERMIRDATALYMESQGYTKPYQVLGDVDKLVGFMGGQARFLQSRLAAMPGDVAYYFPDSEEAVKAALVMADLFKPRDLAMKAAEFMEDTPIVRTVLGSVSASSYEDLTTFVHNILTEVTRLLPGHKKAD